jgi:hypothetical protein
MAHPLSRVPILGQFVDERFLEHRRRSTSLAGVAGALLAAGIFEYRVFWQHFIDRSLFAVLATMAVVKIAAMLWFRFND